MAQIISVIFGGGEETFVEAITAYRQGNQIVMVGGNNVTLTFEADELLALLVDAKEKVRNDLQPE